MEDIEGNYAGERSLEQKAGHQLHQFKQKSDRTYQKSARQPVQTSKLSLKERRA